MLNKVNKVLSDDGKPQAVGFDNRHNDTSRHSVMQGQAETPRALVRMLGVKQSSALFYFNSSVNPFGKRNKELDAYDRDTWHSSKPMLTAPSASRWLFRCLLASALTTQAFFPTDRTAHPTGREPGHSETAELSHID